MNNELKAAAERRSLHRQVMLSGDWCDSPYYFIDDGGGGYLSDTNEHDAKILADAYLDLLAADKAEEAEPPEITKAVEKFKNIVNDDDSMRTEWVECLAAMVDYYLSIRDSSGIRAARLKACHDIGDLFCWCVQNLKGFPPIKGEWIEDIKNRLKPREAAQAEPINREWLESLKPSSSFVGDTCFAYGFDLGETSINITGGCYDLIDGIVKVSVIGGVTAKTRNQLLRLIEALKGSGE